MRSFRILHAHNICVSSHACVCVCVRMCVCGCARICFENISWHFHLIECFCRELCLLWGSYRAEPPRWGQLQLEVDGLQRWTRNDELVCGGRETRQHMDVDRTLKGRARRRQRSRMEESRTLWSLPTSSSCLYIKK